MRQILDRGLTEGDVPAVTLHDRRQQAEILERDVAKGDRGAGGCIMHENSAVGDTAGSCR